MIPPIYSLDALESIDRFFTCKQPFPVTKQRSSGTLAKRRWKQQRAGGRVK